MWIAVLDRDGRRGQRNDERAKVVWADKGVSVLVPEWVGKMIRFNSTTKRVSRVRGEGGEQIKPKKMVRKKKEAKKIREIEQEPEEKGEGKKGNRK